MTRDLYEALGLEPEATPQQIRAGYKRASKTAHPDAGGTSEEFAEIKLAYDILIDPVRRARYDSTGDASEKVADNRMAKVVGFVSAALNAFVTEAAKEGHDPCTFDLIKSVTGILQETLKQSIGAQSKAVQNKMTLAKIRARLTRRSDGEPNILADVLDGWVKNLDEGMERAKADEGFIRQAIELVNDHGFDIVRQQQFLGGQASKGTNPNWFQTSSS